MPRKPFSLERVSQKALDRALCSPHPKSPGSTGILPASAGTGRPAGERGGNPGTAPQRRLLPGSRRSRPRAFTTPSWRERGWG